MFTIIDGDYLKRWDRNKEIQVNNSSIDKVYFTTKAMDMAIEVAVEDGVAKVPDGLLRQAYDITVYGYVDGKCKIKMLAVKDAEKPESYYYYDKSETKIVKLDETVRELEDLSGGSSGGGELPSDVVVLTVRS